MKKEELLFGQFNKLMQSNFEQLHKESDFAFTTETDKEVLWDLYLDSFPEGTNEIYRERREFDCSRCRGFIKKFGNVVFVKDNKLVSIWDFQADAKYNVVIRELAKYVKSRPIKDVYLSSKNTVGSSPNHEVGKDGGVVRTWEHFYASLPDKFVNSSSDTIPEKLNGYRTSKGVFERSLNEISKEAVETVLDLIMQNFLYKGEEWKGVLETFLALHKKYYKLKSEKEKDNFCWITSATVGGAINKIKNHSIGTLLTDVTDETDLNEAVRKYEAIVAPTNYKRPKAIFSKKMLGDAKNKIEELGFKDSLQRRYAHF